MTNIEELLKDAAHTDQWTDSKELSRLVRDLAAAARRLQKELVQQDLDWQESCTKTLQGCQQQASRSADDYHG